MIIGWILQLLFSLLAAVFSLIPEFTVFDPEYSAGTDQVVTRIAMFLKTWDLFVPIETIFVGVLAIFSTKVFVAVCKLVVFVYEKLPFKSA